jgi:chromatin segregation and condensation protein Rec8/ScpA/Scc1 (kleisin family)
MEFAERLPIGKLTEFQSLLSAIPSRPEVVATFLAALELGRLKKMRLHQEMTYSSIYLELLESLKNFDSELASGFDSIVETLSQTSL